MFPCLTSTERNPANPLKIPKMPMTMMIIMTSILFEMGNCASSQGALFRRVRSRSHPVCAKYSTDLKWIDAAAEEMKDFKFLMSCAETPSCKGVQMVPNGMGYHWIQTFPAALTLNATDCQMFYKDSEF